MLKREPRAWLWLARIEMQSAFSRAATGGRDLAYLSAVLGMLIFLVTAVLALYEGLIVNFADSLLGAARPAGIPIYVNADSNVTSRGRGFLFLDMFHNRERFSDLVADGKSGDDQPEMVSAGLERFDFHPVREVENTANVFTIPGKKPGRGRTAWAVSETSPLWQWAEAPKAGPAAHRTLILSERTFLPGFDVGEYQNTMKRYLSRVLLDEWTKEYHSAAGNKVRRLFVLVPGSQGKQRPVELSVHWVSSFPAQYELSFLMSLETLRALRLAYVSPDAKLPWGVQPGSITALKVVNLTDDGISGAARAEAVKKMADCMTPGGMGDIEGESFTLEPPQPEFVRQACAKLHGFREDQFSVAEQEAYDVGVSIGIDAITVPCRLVRGATDDRPRGRPPICMKREDTAKLSAFEDTSTGLVYAAERRDLTALRQAIKNATINKRAAISMSEAYSNALARFDYLLSVLAFVVFPIGTLCALLVAYVMFFQISTWIGHRRAQYGVLLARGMHWTDIYRLCFFQIVLALGIGAIFALALSEFCRWLLAWGFDWSDAADMAKNQLGILRPELIATISFRTVELAVERFAMTLRDYLIALAFVGGLAFVLLAIVLRILPLGPGTSPVSLIVGQGREPRPLPAKRQDPHAVASIVPQSPVPSTSGNVS